MSSELGIKQQVFVRRGAKRVHLVTHETRKTLWVKLYMILFKGNILKSTGSVNPHDFQGKHDPRGIRQTVRRFRKLYFSPFTYFNFWRCFLSFGELKSWESIWCDSQVTQRTNLYTFGIPLGSNTSAILGNNPTPTWNKDYSTSLPQCQCEESVWLSPMWPMTSEQPILVF